MESISGLSSIHIQNGQIVNNDPSFPKTKVLWFASTPSLAARHFGSTTVGGGWIESLEAKLKPYGNIELAVAFIHGRKEIKKIVDDNTTYYAMPDKRSRINTFIDRHFTTFDDAELTATCLEIINDFKPDIINVFGTEKGVGLICGKTDIPVVIHLQGILTVYEKKWFPPGIDKWTLLARSNFKSLLRATTLLHNYAYFKKGAIREQKIFAACKYFMGRTEWDKRICAVLAPGADYFTSNEILRWQFYQNAWNKKPERDRKSVV